MSIDATIWYEKRGRRKLVFRFYGSQLGVIDGEGVTHIAIEQRDNR
jgi:hypothetical protein